MLYFYIQIKQCTPQHGFPLLVLYDMSGLENSSGIFVCITKIVTMLLGLLLILVVCLGLYCPVVGQLRAFHLPSMFF
jgi:hypothetical protein